MRLEHFPESQKHLPCQSPSDSAQPFLEGSRVILSSNEVLKGMRRVFLARVTSAQLPLVPRIVQERCGAVVGLGPRWVLLTATPHRENRRPNESRSFPSRSAHNLRWLGFCVWSILVSVGKDWQHFRKDRITALQGTSNDGRGITARLSGRTLSASARQRIAAAQKARWAKWRAAQRKNAA